jgi:rod shape-determining protein MreD
MTYVAFWLLQDFLTVLTFGTMRIPELFLLYLVYRILSREWEKNVSVIWAAFLGGLIWDLRWIGIPGFFILSYVSVVMVVLWVWNTLPTSGRTPAIIFFLFWASQLLPAVLSALILRRGAEDGHWILFGLQQGCAVPVALLGAFLYMQHEKKQNA